MDEIGLFEAIYSQRQITRYRTDPVPREAIGKIIDAATKAPERRESPALGIHRADRPDVVSEVGRIYQDAWLGALGQHPHRMSRPSTGPLDTWPTTCRTCRR